MSINEDVHQMRAQILNLRSAGIACATAIHHFPPCGRPGGEHLQCPEARAAMTQIYDNMRDLILSVGMTMVAVFNTDPEPWDFVWELHEGSSCTERELAKTGELLLADRDEFIKTWGEMDNDTMDKLTSSFSKEEWEILSAKRAWQNGRRVLDLLHFLTYLEDQIAKQVDLFDSVLHSGLLGDCNVGKYVQAEKAARA